MTLYTTLRTPIAVITAAGAEAALIGYHTSGAGAGASIATPRMAQLVRLIAAGVPACDWGFLPVPIR
jgi:hypothetical protein